MGLDSQHVSSSLQEGAFSLGEVLWGLCCLALLESGSLLIIFLGTVFSGLLPKVDLPVVGMERGPFVVAQLWLRLGCPSLINFVRAFMPGLFLSAGLAFIRIFSNWFLPLDFSWFLGYCD